MEKELNQVIDRLEVKLSKMLSSYKELQEKNRSLQDSVDNLSLQQEHLSTKLSSLEHKYGVLKNANALLGSDEYKKETKLKINALVKEIDQCISQLS